MFILNLKCQDMRTASSSNLSTLRTIKPRFAFQLLRFVSCRSNQCKMLIFVAILFCHTMLSLALSDEGNSNSLVYAPEDRVHVPFSNRKLLSTDSSQDVEVVNDATVVPSSTQFCRNGYIQGATIRCSIHPCMPLLQVKPTNLEHTSCTHSNVIQRLSVFPGQLQKLDIYLLQFLDELQTYFGLQGSVGILDSTLDKYSLLLTKFVRSCIGEKLFVSMNSSERDNVKFFANHLAALGFSSGTSQADVAFHTYSGDQTTLDALSRLNLPQFKLINIEINISTMIKNLETAACTLREGGIIVISGVEGGQPLSKIVDFVTKNSRAPLQPFLATIDRVYFTTSTYRQRYLAYMTDHLQVLHNGQASHYVDETGTIHLNSAQS